MQLDAVDCFSPLRRPMPRPVIRHQSRSSHAVPLNPRSSPRPTLYPRTVTDITIRVPNPQPAARDQYQAPSTQSPSFHTFQPYSSQAVAVLPRKQYSWFHRKLRDFRQVFTNTNSTQRLIVGMAIMLFVAGAIVSIQGFWVNKAVQGQIGGSTVSAQASDPEGGTEDQPSEAAPSAIAQYAVAPDNPRLLIVPKLDIKSRVKALDVDKENNLRVPTNIYDVGWYSQSAKPGSTAGAMLLDGHVSGPTNKGVFYGLKTLEAGDRLSIERGDGKTINYRVVSKQAFPKDKVDMAKALVSIDPAKPGLNLMTCTGKYLSAEKTYAERLVVYAVAE